MSYIFHIVFYLCIYVILALSLNLIVGYSGLLTFAHAAFFSLGAYSYAIMTLRTPIGQFPALIISILIAMILSLAISLPAWRLKGDYFVMISLAVQVLIYSIIYNWHNHQFPLGSLKNLTNGPYGIMDIPKPSFFGYQLNNLASIAVLGIITAGICAVITWLLISSPWGRMLKVIRDDELAARSLGKNSRIAKVQVVAIACGIAAVSGVMYASYVSYIEPSICSVSESILILSMVLIGGVGNFRGPIIGASILIIIPEILRFLDFPDVLAAKIRLLIYGLVLILMFHFRPQGIAGRYRFE